MGAVKRTHHAVVLREREAKDDRRHKQHHRDMICSTAYLDKSYIAAINALNDAIPKMEEYVMKEFARRMGDVFREAYTAPYGGDNGNKG